MSNSPLFIEPARDRHEPPYFSDIIKSSISGGIGEEKSDRVSRSSLSELDCWSTCERRRKEKGDRKRRDKKKRNREGLRKELTIVRVNRELQYSPHSVPFSYLKLYCVI